MPTGIVVVPTATERGRDAFMAGARPDNCPYPPGSVAAIMWLESWFKEDEEFNESVHALCNQRGRMAK